MKFSGAGLPAISEQPAPVRDFEETSVAHQRCLPHRAPNPPRKRWQLAGHASQTLCSNFTLSRFHLVRQADVYVAECYVTKRKPGCKAFSNQNGAIAIFIKKLFTLLDLCVSSLRRGHANLLCIVPILTDDPRRESTMQPCSRMPPAQRALEKGWSCASSPQQRSLHAILIHYPTTAGSVQFCLLCCQPEPMPESLTARMSRFTPWDPCRLPAWLGWTICIACRTCWVL